MNTVMLAALVAAVVSGADLDRMYEAARNRERTIVYNTDGCDMLYYPKNLPVTVEAFTGRRLAHALGTKISTISYCPLSSGFGDFTVMHVGNALTGTIEVASHANDINGTLPFAAIGRDCLEMALEFSRTHGFERFMSIRMNDSHDGGARPHKGYIAPLFSKFRQEHPDCLMGDPGKDYWPKVGKWQWTCCNFAKKEVRDFVLKFVREFCEQYDMEGMELDFCRHLKYFESVSQGGVATAEELRLMSDLVAEIRKITRAYAAKKGHAILLSCRVPDSFAYAKALGLDVETWLDEKSFDIIIGGCYFNLEDLKPMADRVHAAGAKFYASIDESRIRNYRGKEIMIEGRDTVPNFHARYAAAMDAGCDGVYLFNQEHDSLHRETQEDPRDLAGLDKIYFATERGKGGYEPSHYLEDGYRYKKLPLIDPAQSSRALQRWIGPGESYTFEMRLGEDFARAAEKGFEPTATVLAIADGSDAAAFELTMNGTKLATPPCEKRIYAYAIEKALVKKGINVFRIANLGRKEFRVNDFAVRITYASKRPQAVVADEVAKGAKNAIEAIIRVVEEVKRLRLRNADALVEIVPFRDNAVANNELLFFRDRTLSVRGMEKTPRPDLEATTHIWRTEKSHGVDNYRWWYERMREKQACIAKGNGEFDLVMMGDSIIHWWDRGNGDKVRPFLEKTGLKTLNLGYGGDRANPLLWRAENGELDGYRAKLVVLMIGSNNQTESDTVERTAERIGRIVETVRAKQPQAKILLHAIFPRTSIMQGRLRAHSMAVSREIRKFCDGKDVLWLDLTKCWTKEDGTGRFDLLTDGTHPSPAGIRTWLHALSPYIAKYCGKQVDMDPEDSGLKPCTRRWVNYRVDFADERSWKDMAYFAVKARGCGYNGLVLQGFDALDKLDENGVRRVKDAVRTLGECGIELVPALAIAEKDPFAAKAKKLLEFFGGRNVFLFPASGAKRETALPAVVADIAALRELKPDVRVTLRGNLFAGYSSGIDKEVCCAASCDPYYFKKRGPSMVMSDTGHWDPDLNLHPLFGRIADDEVATAPEGGFIYWTDAGDYRYLLDAGRLAIRRD